MPKRTGITEKKEAHWMPSPTSPRLLPLKEAAKYLGLTVWSVRERVWNGDIPVIRFPNGRKQFIDVKDMEAFIQQNKTVFK